MTAPTGFADHVRDAAFHARLLHKSLHRAAVRAPDRRKSGDAERLSQQALQLARALEGAGR